MRRSRCKGGYEKAAPISCMSSLINMGQAKGSGAIRHPSAKTKGDLSLCTSEYEREREMCGRKLCGGNLKIEYQNGTKKK